MEHVTVIWRTKEPVTWRTIERVDDGLRDGDVIAWNEPEFDRQVGSGFEGLRAQRHFLLLGVGVKMTIPNVWIERGDPLWYVDLVMWQQSGKRFDITDFDIDLFVPTDGRPYRTLDLDEFADAIEAGEFTIAQVLDGLRRWQIFLDRHLHIFGPGKDVDHGWRDFPPKSIDPLRRLPDEEFARADRDVCEELPGAS
jgi:hypothetical protein